jgi:hypothetical protein
MTPENRLWWGIMANQKADMKKQSKNKAIAIFEGNQIRRHWDEEKELWYFSIVDVIATLTEQPDHKRAQSYWTTL